MLTVLQEDIDAAAFAAFDSTGQGCISRRELKVMLGGSEPYVWCGTEAGLSVVSCVQYALRGLGFQPSKEGMAQLMAKHARAVEGSLTQQEFQLATQRLREAEGNQTGLHRMFQLLDREGLGYITATDLQQVSRHCRQGR